MNLLLVPVLGAAIGWAVNYVLAKFLTHTARQKLHEKMKAEIKIFLAGFRDDERTLKDVFISLNISQSVIDEKKERVADVMLRRLSDKQLGSYVSGKVINEAQKRLGNFITRHIVQSGIADVIGEIAEKKVFEKLPSVLSVCLNEIENEVMNLKLSSIYRKNEEYVDALAERVAEKLLHEADRYQLKTFSYAGALSGFIIGIAEVIIYSACSF